MLVAAVFRPEEREDRQLEVVRLALEQLDDALQLSVGQSQLSMDWCAVERLLGDLRQVIQSSREVRRQPPRWNVS
jgi:hypothetical protein